MAEKYTWTDNPTESGISECNTNTLNDCLMHLKYDNNDSYTGRNIGDIFYTYRLDESINGAYPCNGGEFSSTDFEGGQNPYELLVLGRIPSVTYEEYEKELVANSGNCGYFALDTENKKFKVPTLHQLSIESTKISGEIGKYIQDQVQDHVHNYVAPNTNNMPRGDDRTGCVSYTYVANSTGMVTGRKGDRTKPRTISLRFMVQLSNTTSGDISVDVYTRRLEEKADEEIIRINQTGVDGRADILLSNVLVEEDGNIISGPRYIKESYLNGTNWYRIWSDGIIEQGGRVTVPSTVTLLKPYTNTNYTVLVTIDQWQTLSSADVPTVNIQSRAATNFTTRTAWTNAGAGAINHNFVIDWRAYGN